MQHSVMAPSSWEASIRRRIAIAAMALTALATAPAGAQGGVVFSDDFAAGTSAGWSVLEQDSVGNATTPTTTTLTVVTDNGSNALRVGLPAAGATARVALRDFPTVSLNNVGDSLTLSFNARWVDIPSTTSAAIDRTFGFGLYDVANGAGYNVRIDLIAAAGTSGDMYQNTASLPRIFDGSSAAHMAGARITTTTGGANSFAGSTSATFALQVERVTDPDASSNDLRLTFSKDGTPIMTELLSDTANGPKDPATFDFGNAFVGFNNATLDGNLFIDNVTVTAVVPEPASIGLLGLAAVAALGRRRRSVE